MEGRREHPLIAGFIYDVDGFEHPVIPVTGRRGGLVFYRVCRDVHGNVFRGGLAALQPDPDGALRLAGQPTGRTLADLRLVSEGETAPWDPLPED